MLLDCTESHYGGKERTTILARFSEPRPFEVDNCPYFGVEELPSRKKSSASAHVVEDVPCAQLGRSDAEILSALGE